jgi:LytS/YehU family sensor histidine kinase
MWAQRAALFPLAGLGRHDYGRMPHRYFMELPAQAIVYALMVAGVHAAARAKEARERQLRAAALEAQLAQARLQNIELQLQPHFLFNALNTISAFTETDPPKARRLMEQLGSLLRASLAMANRPLVTVAEELTFLDDYLAVESARFEGRITVTVDADDTVLGRQIPGFVLQPIVENAIRHGVAPRLSGGHVEVVVAPEGAGVVLRVRDDGVGVPPGWSLATHGGVGLRNVASRLEHLYRQPGLLGISPRAGGGLEVTVTVPSEEPRV